MTGIEGKTAVVVGGTGGIGEAIARKLALEGANVVVSSLHQSAAAEVARTIQKTGGQAIAVEADVSKEDAVASLFQKAVDTYGGVDLFAGNAAAITKEIHEQDSDILATSLAIFDQTIAINLRGLILCSRQALPLMLRRGGGAIVYTSSLASIIGTPKSAAYAMSKAGVNALTRHVASRWGKEGIRCNAVSPGLVMTQSAHEFQDQKFLDDTLAASPVPKIGDGNDLAGMIVFLLSEECTYIQGQVINVNGGALMSE